MKLLGKEIAKDGTGSVQLRPDDDEDLWHLYNLIQEGDEVRGTALRRVVTESSTGSVDSQRVKLTLTIRVQKVVYSPAGGTSAASEDTPSSSTAVLHISGPTTSESKYVKLGAYHTLDIEPTRAITIIKTALAQKHKSESESEANIGSGWDSIALERVQEATEVARGADVGAIVCGEGVANICLITQHTTVIRQRIDVPIPRKRKGGGTIQSAEKAGNKFLQQVYQAILRHFDFDQLKAIIIASPGFTKESVLEYIMAEATRSGNKSIIVAKPKFLLVHSSSHHVHSLAPVLSSPQVASQLKDTKFAKESQLLEQFHRMLTTDELRAWYGEQHVQKAIERGAVGSLLISDDLFRSSDFTRRRRFVEMVEQVKSFGGQVLIFSSLHESGKRLNDLTGIAAILTYPLDVEVVEEEERSEREEASGDS